MATRGDAEQSRSRPRPLLQSLCRWLSKCVFLPAPSVTVFPLEASKAPLPIRYQTDLRVLSLESGRLSVLHLPTGHRPPIWLVNSGLGSSFAGFTVHSQLPSPSARNAISSSLGLHIHSGSPSPSPTAAGASILKCKSDHIPCSPNYLLPCLKPLTTFSFLLG